MLLTGVKVFVTEPNKVGTLESYIYIQMIWGNVIGFLFDQWLGTKEGYTIFKNKQFPDLMNIVSNESIQSSRNMVSYADDNDNFWKRLKRGKEIIWHGKKCDDELITSGLEKFNLEPSFNDSQVGGFKLQKIKEKIKIDPVNSFKYVFQKVGSLQFLKFLITVLIDTIVSIAVFSILREGYFKMTKKSDCDEDPNEPKEKQKLPMMVNMFFQAFIGIVTYQIYVGWSRTYWAYINTQFTYGVEIKLMILMVTVCVFLTGTRLMVTPNSEEEFEKEGKQYKLMGGLFVLFFIYSVMNAGGVFVHGHWPLGFVIFLGISASCIYMAYSSIKCNTTNPDCDSDK